MMWLPQRERLLRPRQSLVAVCLACLLCAISACDSRPVKSESMLYREAAIAEAKPFVTKAKSLFSSDVSAQPQQHLDTLLIVKSALADARQVYQSKGLALSTDPDIERLDEALHTLLPNLATQAVGLMNTSLDKTLAIRQKVEKIKSQPSGMNESGITQQLGSLSAGYNEEVLDCCLNTLAKINELLRLDTKQFKALLTISLNINRRLERVLVEKNYGDALRHEIAQLPFS